MHTVRAQPNCGRQPISMDRLHNLLRPAIAIDGHVSRSNAVDNNVYRLTTSPAHCYHNRVDCYQVSNAVVADTDNIYR